MRLIVELWLVLLGLLIYDLLDKVHQLVCSLTQSHSFIIHQRDCYTSPP